LKGTRILLFPPNLQETLEPYWERELGRLMVPVPEITEVTKDLKGTLDFLYLSRILNQGQWGYVSMPSRARIWAQILSFS